MINEQIETIEYYSSQNIIMHELLQKINKYIESLFSEYEYLVSNSEIKDADLVHKIINNIITKTIDQELIFLKEYYILSPKNNGLEFKINKLVAIAYKKYFDHPFYMLNDEIMGLLNSIVKVKDTLRYLDYQFARYFNDNPMYSKIYEHVSRQVILYLNCIDSNIKAFDVKKFNRLTLKTTDKYIKIDEIDKIIEKEKVLIQDHLCDVPKHIIDIVDFFTEYKKTFFKQNEIATALKIYFIDHPEAEIDESIFNEICKYANYINENILFNIGGLMEKISFVGRNIESKLKFKYLTQDGVKELQKLSSEDKMVLKKLYYKLVISNTPDSESEDLYITCLINQLINSDIYRIVE